MHGDALFELPQPIIGQHLQQFRLAGQDHLDEFALVRLQVGQQAQVFQGSPASWSGHRR
jgi:hypothetical protein